MKYIAFVTVAVLAVGAAPGARAASDGAAQASAPSAAFVTSSPGSPAGGNVASLKTLLAEWDRASFTPPCKPNQHRVYGRNGYVTTGPGYYALASLIRSAQAETVQGRDPQAAAHIAKARTLLAGAAGQQQTTLTTNN